MTGYNGIKAVAIDHKALQKVLKQYGRLEEDRSNGRKKAQKAQKGE